MQRSNSSATNAPATRTARLQSRVPAMHSHQPVARAAVGHSSSSQEDDEEESEAPAASLVSLVLAALFAAGKHPLQVNLDTVGMLGLSRNREWTNPHPQVVLQKSREMASPMVEA